MSDEFYTSNHMSSSSCTPIKFGFGFSFIDFILFLIVLFFMYCPIGVSPQVVVSGNETSCGYGYGCPYLPQQQQQISSDDVDDVLKKEKKVEKSAEKIHEEKLRILTKENQLLSYELEQAKLKYSIQKLITETHKLSTITVSEAATETEDSVEVDV